MTSDPDTTDTTTGTSTDTTDGNAVAAATATSDLAMPIVRSLADIVASAASPQALAAQQQLLLRLATQADVFPSRIPPPRNITEVGGYFNLLGALGEDEVRNQAIAAALGVAAAGTGGVPATGRILADVLRPDDRPPGPAQASIPVQFAVRSDFASALDTALAAIHAAGATLPLLSSPPDLPPTTGPADATDLAGLDLLGYLGRTLTLVPAAALADPDTDPLALATASGSTTLQVVARQLDPTAPQAATVPAADWAAWACDDTVCTSSTAERHYLPLTPILAAAGWYQPEPATPTSRPAARDWTRWTNITGLVPGVSRYRDELVPRWGGDRVSASVLVAALDWVWDGDAFADAGA